ncbi:MAG: FliM/FliN family flagellar motor switch protein [Exilibacterium sp.]
MIKSTPRLSLRKLYADRARATALLGQGMHLDFAHPTGSGRISLRQTPDYSMNNWEFFHTGAGNLILVDGEGVLNLLSDSPAAINKTVADKAPKADNPDSEWIWQLYNYYLLKPLQEVFGSIKQIHTPLEAGIPCLIQVSRGKNTAECSALIPCATLENMLKNGNWYPQLSPLPENWIFSSPLCLGKTQLQMAQLKRLATGDIVLATQPFFSSRGEGRLNLANLSISVEFVPSDSHYCFTVYHIEELSMNDPAINEPNESEANDAAMNQTAENSFADDEISQIPMLALQSNEKASLDSLTCNLSICSGTVSTTLSELRRLQVGSVLLARGEAPGNACLKSGNRTIARGELVDVDGQLGIQITSVDF